jgi:hypothetical protein
MFAEQARRGPWLTADSQDGCPTEHWLRHIDLFGLDGVAAIYVRSGCIWFIGGCTGHRKEAASGAGLGRLLRGTNMGCSKQVLQRRRATKEAVLLLAREQIYGDVKY